MSISIPPRPSSTISSAAPIGFEARSAGDVVVGQAESNYRDKVAVYV